LPERLWAENLKLDKSFTAETAVQVNGSPVHAIIDTGSALRFAISESYARRLGLKLARPVPPDNWANPGKANFGLTEPCELNLFGEFTKMAIPVVRLPTAEGTANVEGILGWPYVYPNILAIYLPEGVIGLMPELPEPAGVPALKFPLAEGGTLGFVVRDGANGNRRVVIDTGSRGGVMLSERDWRQWRASHPKAPITLEVIAVLGDAARPREWSWADSFELGPLVLKSVPVSEVGSMYQREPGENVVALGLSAIARMIVLVEPQTKTVHLAGDSASRFTRSYNRIGAVFVPEGDRDDEIVAKVAAGGPAAVAGLQDGDLLVAINGKSVKDRHTSDSAREVFEEYGDGHVAAGTKITYTVRSQKKQKEIFVIARDLFPDANKEPNSNEPAPAGPQK
jgi:hypothetical protein